MTCHMPRHAAVCHDRPGSLFSLYVRPSYHQQPNDATAHHARCCNRHASCSGNTRLRRRVAWVGGYGDARASSTPSAAAAMEEALIVADDQTRRRYSSLFDDGSTTSSANLTFLITFFFGACGRCRSWWCAPLVISSLMSVTSRRWRWYEMRMMLVDAMANATSPRQLPAPRPLCPIRIDNLCCFNDLS